MKHLVLKLTMILEIFLTQVMKEESQVLLNKTMTMDENFDVNLMPDEEGNTPTDVPSVTP